MLKLKKKTIKLSVRAQVKVQTQITHKTHKTNNTYELDQFSLILEIFGDSMIFKNNQSQLQFRILVRKL